jgi:hypothetical protein
MRDAANRKLHAIFAKGRMTNWIVRARGSTVAVFAGFLGGILATSTDLTEKVFTLTDRLGWTHSEQVLLAQDSAKSNFSDALVRSAWRRLFLADLFARRVLDAASLPTVPPHTVDDINDAWNQYIAALADWNGNLMINIVGMEHYYDAAKSQDFEGPIQSQFSTIDTHLRQLRLSKFVQKVRAGDKEVTGADRAEIKVVTDVIFWDTEVQRRSLYFFVRCFSALEKNKKTAHCDLPTFISEQIRQDPSLR